MTMGLATTLRSARAAEIITAAGTGAKLRLYNSTRPATGGSATTLLAEMIWTGENIGTESGGVITLNVPDAGTGLADSTATWARIVTSANAFVADMSVGTSGQDLNLNTTTISTGVAVSVSSGTITEGNA